DVYRSNLQADGTWSELENLGSVINTRKADGLSCISDDGKTLFIVNTDKKAKFPLFMTTEGSNGEFSEPVPVMVDGYYNNSKYFDFYVSEKFGVMFLAVERRDSRGGQDLYVSVRKPDGTFGAPQHMGGSINSGRAEFAPFLGPYGKRLYFCSYGFKGKGGADIFYAERTGESWTSWGRPVNLGDGFNSRGQEIYFSFTGDFSKIYIESWDRAHDDRDIVQMDFPEYMRPKPEGREAEVEPEPIVVEPQPVIASASEAAPASLTPEQEAAIDEAAENQRMQREQNRQVLASALTEDTEPIDIISTRPEEEKEEERFTPTLEPSAPLALNSQWVRERENNNQLELKYLRNMYFGTGSESVDPNYHTHLDRIVDYMTQYPEMSLSIEGHTDVVGSDGVNMRLSSDRANATAEYLISQGIAQERILTKGFGADKPLASNDDELDGRELNRRVEISLIPKGD
ncbi:MAG: OmpA family protein, partial [Bacteroidota bacterium]